MDKSIHASEQDFGLIARFFDFDLSDEELTAFNKRMKEEAAFRENFKIYQQMDAFIDEQTKESVEMNAIKTNFKAHSSSTATQKTPEKTAAVLPFRRILSIAAAILFLVVGGIIIRNFLAASPSPEVLAQNYWDNSNKITFSNLKSNATSSESTKILITASDLYNTQNFSATIATLATITKEDAVFPNAALLKGEAQLALQQYPAAINSFKQVLEHPQGTYKSSALWFQALAYLHTNQVALAKANLATIIQQKYPTAQKARELLAQLD